MTNEDRWSREGQKRVSESNSRTMDAMGGMIPLVAVILVVVSIVSAVIFFGKNLFVKVAGDDSTITVVRNEKSGTFMKRGKLISFDEVGAKKAALKTFLQSGASYRMEGSFQYGYYKSGGDVELETNVKMFYNSENNVYKFVLESEGGDSKLDAVFRIADGVYYIVQENGNTYLFSETDGKKTVENVGKNSKTYNFLMCYCMEKVMYTDVIDRKDTDRRHLWDTDFYLCSYDDVGYMVYTNPKTELRIYKGKPVYYVHRIKNKNTGIESQFILNFYYDEIPQDKPPVINEYK